MRTTLFDNPKRWETESDRILTTITGTTSWKETTQAIGSQITKESEIHYASCNVLGLQKEDTASLTSLHKKARRRLTSLSCVIQQGMLRPAPPAVTLRKNGICPVDKPHSAKKTNQPKLILLTED